MNVGLWAEIRRLAEIEKLSGRAVPTTTPLLAAHGGRGARIGPAP